VLSKLTSFVRRTFAGRALSEMRAYQRYSIWNPVFSHAVILPSTRCRIRDMSYGGMGLSLDDSSKGTLEGISSTARIKISVLDHSCEMEATKTYLGRGIAGFCFHHRTLEGLDFLRGVLECMRIGASLRPDASNKMDAPEDLLSWHGADDAKMAIKVDPGVPVPDVYVRFPANGSVHELYFGINGLRTNTILTDPDLSAQVIRTSRIEKPVLRNALFVLMGLEDEQARSLVGAAINKALAELGIDSSLQ
jgi:hypothetical protein